MHLKTFYAFQWPFKDILVNMKKKKQVTADGLMTICSGLDSFCLFLFFSLLIFFPPSSSCKIGVWLNTCKLCCDYQPLKSSLKLNLYIVKFPRLIISSVRMCLRVCTRTSEVTQIFIVFFVLSQSNQCYGCKKMPFNFVPFMYLLQFSVAILIFTSRWRLALQTTSNILPQWMVF